MMNAPVSMHGSFDLRESVSAVDFKVAFDAFSKHLSEQGYVVGWRFMVRKPHDGYDARPPSSQFYICMDFKDEQASLDCWDYVKKDRPPLKELHRAVNSKVINTTFFLCEEVEFL